MKKLIFLLLMLFSRFANAQEYYEHRSDPIEWFFILTGFIIAFLLGSWITRSVLSVPKFLRYQKIQTLIMLRMAERQGMPKEESMALLNILEEMQSAKFTYLSDLRFIIKKLDGEETLKKE